MSEPIYEVYSTSTNQILGVIGIPHTGQHIPNELRPYLVDTAEDLDCDLDYEVHQLLDFKLLGEAGIVAVRSHIHRAAIDLNRTRELALFNWKSNSKGKKLVISEPERKLAEEALHKYYDAYYAKLDEVLTQSRLFIDFHSMPSMATDYHLKKNPHQKKDRPDFCLSDLDGESIPRKLTDRLVKSLEKSGYAPLINDPYRGGHGTQHAHSKGVKALQIETKRALYMDEKNQSLLDEKVSSLKKTMTDGLIDIFKAADSSFREA